MLVHDICGTPVISTFDLHFVDDPEDDEGNLFLNPAVVTNEIDKIIYL